jgi:hypothetical protein
MSQVSIVKNTLIIVTYPIRKEFLFRKIQIENNIINKIEKKMIFV